MTDQYPVDEPIVVHETATSGGGITIEPVDEPIVPPARRVDIRMTFKVEGEPDVAYSSSLDHPYGADPSQYAKVVAEIVERTAMLELGALPILKKVEAAA